MLLIGFFQNFMSKLRFPTPTPFYPSVSVALIAVVELTAMESSNTV